MPTADPSDAPISTFADAASAVLDWCAALWPMGLWMVTRRFGEDWQVLDIRSTAYDIERGAVLRWSDSLCARMIAAEGPRVAPDAELVEAYRSAPLSERLPIKSYVGIPIALDGGTFGTLCAIDPGVQQRHLLGLQPTLELVAGLLGSVLAAERRAEEARRTSDGIDAVGTSDPLTRLWNRDGWNSHLAIASSRASSLGDQFVVAIVDLDDVGRVNERAGYASGDELLREAGRSLRSIVGPTGVAARLGGDEFGVLMPASPDMPPRTLAAKIRDALFASGVSASVGVSGFRWPMSSGEAAAAADAHLYAEKLRRQIQREAASV